MDYYLINSCHVLYTPRVSEQPYNLFFLGNDASHFLSEKLFFLKTDPVEFSGETHFSINIRTT